MSVCPAFGPPPPAALPVRQPVMGHVVHLICSMAERELGRGVQPLSALSIFWLWGGSLVHPLTTNCLLLPCCLDKQPGGRGVRSRRPIRGGGGCCCLASDSSLLGLALDLVWSRSPVTYRILFLLLLPLLREHVEETLDALPVPLLG